MTDPAPPTPQAPSDPAPSDPAPSDPAPSDPAPSDPAPSDPATAWRTEQATRLAVIVDAADYFTAARAAMLKARRRIILVGWDFDTRVDLGETAGEPAAPRIIGDFILWLVRHRPDLEVYLLRWDMGALKAVLRGTTILTVLRWMLNRRIHVKLDGHHPPSASHHQKIVVIDDRVAFCGGIDMTSERWDTRAHADDDPGRVTPSGRPCKPWHDAICAVEGPAAAALGDLCRERWLAAAGKPLAPVAERGDCWPDALEPDFQAVAVAISRTMPRLADRQEVREIEAMTVDLIGRAERLLYIESQYFASRRIAEVIARRLAEPDGPEIVLINPETAQGWLEPIAMDSARARLVEQLAALDTHGRFRIYHPFTDAGVPIYVHAKILIADDRVIRVGSSNLNNRSMGLDTECDLTVETGGDAAARARILRIRDGLLAEHLGRPIDTVAARIAADGSLIAAIEALRGPGHSLRPYERPEVEGIKAWLADNEVLDPEAPGEMFEALSERRLIRRLVRRRRRLTGGRGS